MSINQVILTGRVGSINTIYLESGSVKTTLSLAIEDFSNGNKKTHWIDAECWNDTAKRVQEYVNVGDLIGITGSLKTNLWETPAWDKDKNEETTLKRKQLLVLAHRIEFLSSKHKDQDS